jgi:exopolysaccharide biosynthesis polyprenyl glycosylphosphotransferase
VSTPAPAVAASPADTTRSVVSSSYGRRDYLIRRLLALGDVVAVAGALTLAALVGPHGRVGEQVAWGLVITPAWPVIFKLYGLYDRDHKRMSHGTLDDLPWLLHAVLVGGLLTWAFYKWAPTQQLVLDQILVFGLSTLALVLACRYAVRRGTLKWIGPERVLIIGDRQTTNLVSKLRAHPEYGLEPIGLVTRSGDEPAIPSLPVLADVDSLDLGHLLSLHDIDRLVISHTALAENEMLELLRECREFGLKVSLLPQLLDVMGPSLEIDDVEGLTVLGINPTILPRSSRFLKRGLDVTVSATALLVAAPAIAVVALLIKLDSRGPVFFRQNRIGKGGRPFKLAKFRTMVPDADRIRHELAAHSEDPNWLKLEDDPRITRVGRVLRHSSLDELPELWNVLKGEMSLVGPRPLIESEDRQVRGWARGRLDLTPGITGLWQVLGRTEIPFAEMIKLDYLYVTNWSLWTDIRLILRTVPAVLTRRGAN